MGRFHATFQFLDIKPGADLANEIVKAQAYMLSAQRPVLWFANLFIATATGVALWSSHSPLLMRAA